MQGHREVCDDIVRRVDFLLATRFTQLTPWLSPRATGALGQTTGDVVGQVVDVATKAPAVGVRECAFSPSLIGTHVATTDETGWYRLAQLPPALYVLVFEGREFMGETWGTDVRAGATRSHRTLARARASPDLAVRGARLYSLSAPRRRARPDSPSAS